MLRDHVFGIIPRVARLRCHGSRSSGNARIAASSSSSTRTRDRASSDAEFRAVEGPKIAQRFNAGIIRIYKHPSPVGTKGSILGLANRFSFFRPRRGLIFLVYRRPSVKTLGYYRTEKAFRPAASPILDPARRVGFVRRAPKIEGGVIPNCSTRVGGFRG